MSIVKVNFIARDGDASQWQMVLVEEGPWAESEIELNLRRVQDRLYGCLDAALDGELAKLYPESIGKSVLIRLDCYNVPESEMKEYFRRFSENVFDISEYRTALADCKYVRGIALELNCSQIHEAG